MHKKEWQTLLPKQPSHLFPRDNLIQSRQAGASPTTWSHINMTCHPSSVILLVELGKGGRPFTGVIYISGVVFLDTDNSDMQVKVLRDI